MTLLNKLNKKYWNELIKYKNNSKYIEWNKYKKRNNKKYTKALYIYITLLYIHIHAYRILFSNKKIKEKLKETYITFK